jgi:hypothetical protein
MIVWLKLMNHENYSSLALSSLSGLLYSLDEVFEVLFC